MPFSYEGLWHSLYILFLYNNPSYSRILIGSCLWSIRGQMHDWRHHYKVFASAVLKWRKVLRIRIIFYVTGQTIRYKKVLPRHWTGSRSQKTKDKAVFVLTAFWRHLLSITDARQHGIYLRLSELISLAGWCCQQNGSCFDFVFSVFEENLHKVLNDS